MMRLTLTFVVFLVILMTSSAFVTKNAIRYPRGTRVQVMQDPFTSITSSNIVNPFISITSSSTIIATIDADIAKISNEDFGLVFAGGILVMVGGVLSALIVGFILEKSNNYAQIVADSYAEGGDDAFLNSLSLEDREKAKEMLEKLRQSKGGKGVSVDTIVETPEVKVISEIPKRETATMFNDYSD